MLADYGASVEPPAVRGEPTGDERPGVPGAPAGGGIRIFRKRANPRATADKGGWASYDQLPYFNVLTANDSGSNLRQKHIIFQDGRLRAPVPVEWERLQGFPDDWTAGGRDGDRMRWLGDAMNVDLARWLGRRLMHVEKALPLLSSVA